MSESHRNSVNNNITLTPILYVQYICLDVIHASFVFIVTSRIPNSEAFQITTVPQ